MSGARRASPPDILADPFAERRSRIARITRQVLGARFEFECASRELRRLVASAYEALPRHRLSSSVPRVRVRLVPAGARDARPGGSRGRSAREPEPVGMCSGSGLLCGMTPSSSFAVMSVRGRAALVAFSPEMLASPYHARYELLGFTVFTLAARIQGLVPLHAGCIGRDGRAILLMGASGAGKSTAALHCLLRGWDFIAEDSVFVDPASLRATGVPNFLHLRREALRHLPPSCAALLRRFPIIRRRSGVEKFELDVRRAGLRLAPQPLRIGAVVFLCSRSAGRAPLLAPLDRLEAVRRLAAAQPYAAGQSVWPRFERALRAVPVFELRRGRHPSRTADALEALLEEAPQSPSRRRPAGARGGSRPGRRRSIP